MLGTELDIHAGAATADQAVVPGTSAHSVDACLLQPAGSVAGATMKITRQQVGTGRAAHREIGSIGTDAGTLDTGLVAEATCGTIAAMRRVRLSVDTLTPAKPLGTGARRGGSTAVARRSAAGSAHTPSSAQ